MLKQLTVSVCSRLWSLVLGYAVTSNRIGSPELNENAFKGLACARLFIFTKEKEIYGSLTTVCIAWKEIIEYQYLFTYGYKKQLHPISLTFSLDDYPHLAGFQYMKDISLPNYSSAKIADRILEGKILFDLA